jgi:hypothetical protein
MGILVDLVLAAGRVAASIAHFVSFEVGNLIDRLRRFTFIANVWLCAFIAVLGIETVIYVALEVIRAMEPRASANEDTTRKPFRAVVAVRSASIRSNVIVAVRAVRGDANVNADLSPGFWGGYRETDSSDSG